jgi:hypothetical protein
LGLGVWGLGAEVLGIVKPEYFGDAEGFVAPRTFYGPVQGSVIRALKIEQKRF